MLVTKLRSRVNLICRHTIFREWGGLFRWLNFRKRKFPNIESFIPSRSKSGTSPASLYQVSNHQGDVIIKAKTTGYAKTMAVIGLVAAVGAGLIACSPQSVFSLSLNTIFIFMIFHIDSLIETGLRPDSVISFHIDLTHI
jgi:hypothetical protein